MADTTPINQPGGVPPPEKPAASSADEVKRKFEEAKGKISEFEKKEGRKGQQSGQPSQELPTPEELLASEEAPPPQVTDTFKLQLPPRQATPSTYQNATVAEPTMDTDSDLYDEETLIESFPTVDQVYTPAQPPPEGAILEPSTTPADQEVPKPTPTHEPFKTAPTDKQIHEAYLATLSKEAAAPKKEKPEEVVDETKEVLDAAAKTAHTELESKGHPLKKEQKVKETTEVSGAMIGQKGGPPPGVTEVVKTPYTRLNSQVQELFDKLAATLTMLTTKEGDRETTITINNPNSKFNGAAIVIKESATARNQFNIQLSGSPQAVELFNANIGNLEAAFAAGNYGFKVNILKPVLEERLSTRRVERATKEEKDMM